MIIRESLVIWYMQKKTKHERINLKRGKSLAFSQATYGKKGSQVQDLKEKKMSVSTDLKFIECQYPIHTTQDKQPPTLSIENDFSSLVSQPIFPNHEQTPTPNKNNTQPETNMDKTQDTQTENPRDITNQTPNKCVEQNDSTSNTIPTQHHWLERTKTFP